MSAKTLVKVRQGRQLSIPKVIADQVGVQTGDFVEFSVGEDGVIRLSVKQVVDKNQAWFFSSEWQKKEAEASGDISSGKTKTFEDSASFLEWLRDG